MSGPIRISVLADTKDLRSNLGGAEKSLKAMGTTAEKAARDVDKSMAGVNDAVDGTASNASVLAGAFGDVAGGLGLIGLGGFSDELEAAAPALMLVAGAADIASVAMNTLSLSKIKDTAATVANKAASLASAAAAKAQAAAQWALNAAMSANPVLLLVVAIAALVAGLVIAYKKSETFRNIVNGAFAAIKNVVTSVLPAIKKVVTVVFDGIKAYFTTTLNIYKTVFSAAWNAIKRVTSAAFTGVKELIVKPIGAVVTFIAGVPAKITALGGKFKQAGSAIMNKIIEGIKSAAGFIGNIASSIWNSVKDLLNGGIDKINSALEFSINLPFGKSVSINPPDIPHLARGGITTGPTLAVVGDNPGGREAVIPLNRYDLSGSQLADLLGQILKAIQAQGKAQHDDLTDVGRAVAQAIHAHSQQQRRGAASVAMGRSRGYIK